jgi:hypothetical protein
LAAEIGANDVPALNPACHQTTTIPLSVSVYEAAGVKHLRKATFATVISLSLEHITQAIHLVVSQVHNTALKFAVWSISQ